MTSKKRLILSYGILALLLAVLFAANLFWGSVSLTPGAVLAALTGRGQDALSVGIITQLRLPRAVMVVLLGAALSAAGYLLQTFFANPIAGPFVMGISSGAKLAVALVMVAFLNQGLLTSSLTLITAAFAGAMASMAFVLAVSRRVQRMSILVICGVMIGYICSAVTEFVVAFAQDSNIVNLHNWSQGSFSGMTWGNVRAAALVVLPALAAAFCLSKPMAAYQMGEAYARSVGINVKAFSRLLVLLSSLLAACVTAFAGPISFVGIAVPHLVKQLFGSARPLVVLPGCCLGGAACCLLCDLLDRTRNILDISARMCRRKPRLQRFLRIFQKPCNVFRHILFISYVDSSRRISDSALERDSDVNADDIAFEDKAVMPPDSVDNLVIDGDADVSGITAIIQECGLSPHGADHFAGDIVKILGRHP